MCEYKILFMVTNLINKFNNFFLNNDFFISFIMPFLYKLNSNLAIKFSIKFVISVSFLLLMRGGTPRYRYDYLTKIGWLKFLSINLSIILYIILFFILI